MRLTSGSHRGRPLLEPKGKSIRPTSDKVRQAIFNILTARMDLQDIVVMDIFCGTGALSFESLSRGALKAILCDKDASSLGLAKENAKNLGFSEQCQFFKADSRKGFKKPQATPKPELVFCDPPYAQDLIMPALMALVENEWLDKGCILVLESEKSFVFEDDNFMILTEKIYGDTKITVLEKDK